MNRLQKKCVIGTVGIHLLLLTILIVGPAFFNPQPKIDNTQILDVIPANLVDAAINSGVQGARPPAPTPVTPQPPQPVKLFGPTPALPTPAPAPAPEPTPVPQQSLLDRFEKMLTPKPAPPSVQPDLTPTERQTHKDNIKIDLTHKVTRTAQQQAAAAAVQANNAANQRLLNNTLRSLSHSLSSATTVDVPGNSSAAYANYASVVKSVYERTLLPLLPSQIAQDNENTKVSVDIASDGTVISSQIISPSGDSAWDNAVQRTLDQVTFVAAFPEGDTEKQRHYTINFNPQVERELQ